MNITKIIGIVLIVSSLALGYFGVDTIADSGGSVELLGADISVSDDSQKEQGYMYLGLAVVLFGGGLYTMNKE